MSFGWSAGDIVISIKIVQQVVEAFDSAKGARKQYASSRAFLRALVPVLNRIKQYLENPEEDCDHEAMSSQGKIISEAYEEFEAHLSKRFGLSSRQSDVRSVVHTLLSVIDNLQKKVEKFRSKVVDAVAFLGPLLAFEIK
jgi:hypothetical protein